MPQHRNINALTGKKDVARRSPLIFNIGLDFGTAFTKCLIRDVSNNVAYPLFLGVNGHKTFLIPSEVRLKADRLAVPFDGNYDGHQVNYLKMALCGFAFAGMWITEFTIRHVAT